MLNDWENVQEGNKSREFPNKIERNLKKKQLLR